MSKQNKLLHFAASAARTLHLWPLIVRSGLFNSARRRKYPDTIVHLDVVLTECCTLRCKSCSNLMQYYHHPENLDVDEVISHKYGGTENTPEAGFCGKINFDKSSTC